MRVEIEQLSHTYPGRPALENLSFEVPDSQIVALLGPSGCGKSTLLRLIAHLLTPGSGQIRLDGLTTAQISAERRIAWMAQSPALLPWLTVQGNAALAGRFQPAGLPPRMAPEEALRRVGLADMAGAYPFMLSGGMQQRLALARALTLSADLWLMDEPFAALDELTRENLIEELFQLWQPFQPTVLWVTHHIYEAVRLADRVLIFSPRPGRLLADLPIALARPRREADADFQAAVSQIRAVLRLPGPARGRP